MKLKKAFIKDIFELKKICVEAYSLNFHDHWHKGGLEWYLNNEFNDKRLTDDLSDENTTYYFIEHQDKIIGFIKIKINVSSDLFGHSSELEKIYVLPDYKGMGLGKMALKEIVNITKNRGKESIFLCVIDSNKSAIAFYEKLAFKFHSKTTIDIPYFKEELKGMNRMIKILN